MNKRYIYYRVEKSPLKTRPGYIAYLYKGDDTYETIFGKNKMYLEKFAQEMLDWE